MDSTNEPTKRISFLTFLVFSVSQSRRRSTDSTFQLSIYDPQFLPRSFYTGYHTRHSSWIGRMSSLESTPWGSSTYAEFVIWSPSPPTGCTSPSASQSMRYIYCIRSVIPLCFIFSIISQTESPSLWRFRIFCTPTRFFSNWNIPVHIRVKCSLFFLVTSTLLRPTDMRSWINSMNSFPQMFVTQTEYIDSSLSVRSRTPSRTCIFLPRNTENWLSNNSSIIPLPTPV